METTDVPSAQDEPQEPPQTDAEAWEAVQLSLFEEGENLNPWRRVD